MTHKVMATSVPQNLMSASGLQKYQACMSYTDIYTYILTDKTLVNIK